MWAELAESDFMVKEYLEIETLQGARTTLHLSDATQLRIPPSLVLRIFLLFGNSNDLWPLPGSAI